ncbi:RmlC-like cupin domain-containing protein [Xylogone sp. PMI_703]|nr:RmlC-like cupin domain-containing protein [Xylogone sp. PMI_703]
MHFSTISTGIWTVVSAAFHVSAAKPSSLWVDEVPNYVRPYAVQIRKLITYEIGQQSFRIPITGPSSGGEFTLQLTNAPGSPDLGVLPHLHERHYEDFYVTKGALQLWTTKDGINDTRILTKGDNGAVPQNTKHTFQHLAPNTGFASLIFPGGFEDLYYYLADKNTTFATGGFFDPLAADRPPQDINITDLFRFDVYAQPDFTPRSDAVNGAAPAGSVWHNGPNELAQEPGEPFYIANDYGPTYLNSEFMGYHIVQPFITPALTAGNFSITKISLSELLPNVTVPVSNFANHMGLQILDGQLSVKVGWETIQLLEDDVLFIPANTSFQYWSEVGFTSFVHWSTGAGGLGSELISKGINWTSPMWPAYA